jgi:transcriptional regulator with XRE-family HTH domain
MLTALRTATVTPVVDNQGDRKAIGEDIRDRRRALGLNHSELAALAKVDRSRVTKAEKGDESLRDSTIGAIHRALSDLEQEMGMDLPSRVVAPNAPHVIRFVVEGVYGAKALVVEGPVENIAELEAAVDRIMRRLQAGANDAEGK